MPKTGVTCRCPWVDLEKPDYVAYHDREWGVPVHDDRMLFEFLTLEAAQAGLSWYTVLRKRENYRAAFDGFDPAKVARYTPAKVERLMADPGIIRNRAKILAAIGNAKRFLEAQKEFGSFDAYIWGFTGGAPIDNRLRSRKDYADTSPESDAMSRDLKKRGFKFVGSTICYAHMQATGMVNDHILDCFRHAEVQSGLPVRESQVSPKRASQRGSKETPISAGKIQGAGKTKGAGKILPLLSIFVIAAFCLTACDNGSGPGNVPVPNPLTDPLTGPPAGNLDGHCAVPAPAGPADASDPDAVVGDGTAGSCTAEAFIAAVAKGGTIAFSCGAAPVTISLTRPAKVFNDAKPDVVIDGAGLITLSGSGSSRILYMNTCDPAQHWTTSHCQDQDHPRLTVQNLTFVDGDSRGETEFDGGGAVWVRGGRFKAVNCRFFNNVCAPLGPDVGGGAIRVLSQSQGLPVYLVNCTFGGAEGLGNSGSNGGGISSIGVSWTVINSLFSHNRAVGNGGNPSRPGTPGGGSGGAIYNDGLTMTLSLCGTLIEENQVNAHGAAVFFVTNDHSGDIRIAQSVIRNNHGGSWYALPGISMHEDTRRVVTGSTLE